MRIGESLSYQGKEWEIYLIQSQRKAVMLRRPDEKEPGAWKYKLVPFDKLK